MHANVTTGKTLTVLHFACNIFEPIYSCYFNFYIKQHRTTVDAVDWPVCETKIAMQLSLKY